jgi:hypothetical protein
VAVDRSRPVVVDSAEQLTHDDAIVRRHTPRAQRGRPSCIAGQALGLCQRFELEEVASHDDASSQPHRSCSVAIPQPTPRCPLRARTANINNHTASSQPPTPSPHLTVNARPVAHPTPSPARPVVLTSNYSLCLCSPPASPPLPLGLSKNSPTTDPPSTPSTLSFLVTVTTELPLIIFHASSKQGRLVARPVSPSPASLP